MVERPKEHFVLLDHSVKCEMVELLAGLSGVKILGDFTKWHESVSLDEVSWKHGPGIPISCYGTY